MPEPDPEAFAAFMANFQQMTAENQRRLAEGIASLAREQSQPSPSTHSAQTAENEEMPQTADAQPSHEPSPITPAEEAPSEPPPPVELFPAPGADFLSKPLSPITKPWADALAPDSPSLELEEAHLAPSEPSKDEALPSSAVDKPSTAPAAKHGRSLRQRRAPRNLRRIRLPRWILRQCQTRLCLRLQPGTARGTNRRAFGHRPLLRLFMNRSQKRDRAASAGAGMAAGGTISLAFRASSRQPKLQGLALSIMPSRSTRTGVKIDAFSGRRLRRLRPGRPPRTPLPTPSPYNEHRPQENRHAVEQLERCVLSPAIRQVV